MNKIIFVNGTSCTSGGALTILNQFIDNIDKYDKDNKYYIFSTNKLNIKNPKVICITDIKGKSYKDRIIWDMFGMKKWAKDKNIDPDIIISLQNTAVRFKGKKQIIYLHQCLPYVKEGNWSLFKKDERKLWFYKYIFKIWIHKSIKKDMYIVVQNQWLKNALMKYGYKDENIIISTPDLPYIDVENVKKIDLGDKINYFYPAADHKYKNHEVLLQALKVLKEENIDIYKKVNLIFTLDKGSWVYKKALELKVNEAISFVGQLSYEQVLEYYKSCYGILFPSYIETVGLPLIEAASFGKKIFVANCEYSNEVLESYDNKTFIDYCDYKDWAKKLIKYKNEYLEKSEKIKFKFGWQEIFKLIE